jgi:glycosyltransferase involved in cell wall biosynthesis
MRIAICTDAWRPQVNGVVTTLDNTRAMLERFGYEVRVFSPADGHRTLPLPGYAEIRLPLLPRRRLFGQLDEFAPDCLHIATEAPIGMAARAWCLARDRPFTTSYHTQFPEYLHARLPVPLGLTYGILRRFHGRAERTLVATEQMRVRLAGYGFDRLVIWTRGVDTELFVPREEGHRATTPELLADLPRPLWVCAGRVAVEKNLEAFLRLSLPGSKLIIGDGPARAGLQRQFPDAHFIGYRFGAELAACLAAGDVFVFPSRTDTFGLVMLEAMACGLPVAAYPVTGPIDVITQGLGGVLDEDLERACHAALALDRTVVRAEACRFSWEASARQFETHMVALADAATATLDPGS